MTNEIYKVITVDDKQVYCIDQIDGFSLEIDGSRYHVYADEEGSHVDLVLDSEFIWGEREYIGKIDDDGTADEEKAARFIISFWNGG